MDENVDLCMGTAVGVVDDYGYLLMEVIEGERDADSVLATFLPSDE